MYDDEIADENYLRGVQERGKRKRSREDEVSVATLDGSVDDGYTLRLTIPV